MNLRSNDRRLRLDNNKRIQDPPANRQHGHRFLVLDSWRGICAVGVAIFHMNFAGPTLPSPSFKGYLFVDYFFVLSGFVISAAYFERLSDRAALVHFIIRRFGRIYPVHLMILIGCLASVLVLAIYVFAHESGFVSRLLRQRPFLGLGTLSYSLYMVHYPLYRGIDLVSRRAGGEMPAPVLMAIFALCGALALASAVHFFIERPGMRLFGVWAERARSALTKRHSLSGALAAGSASEHLR
jgi:peptidoglycan/LPS O-acetylase OafA/YrhL